MGTTAAKLTKAIETKENIRQAINDAGVTVATDVVFSDYPNYINQLVKIPTGNIEVQSKTNNDVAAYATASVKSGSATFSNTTIDQNTPTISVSAAGLITATVPQKTATVTSSTTAGWIASINNIGLTLKQKTATSQLTTQAAKTITPTTSAQTAVATNRYTTGNVIVAAIPDNYADISDASEVNDDTAEYIPSGTVLYGKSTDSTSSAVTPSKVTGTATKYAAKNIVLDATNSDGSYTNTTADIEQGYHETGTVKIVVQDKTITSSNTTQTVTPDAGKVLGSVTVNAIGTGTLATPTIDTTTGKVTAKISTGGYLAANTSTTLSLSTQAAKTITPSTTAQTAVDKNKYTLGAVTVAAIPSNYGNVSDATGTAADVLSGKIVYGKNSSTGAAVKLTGTMTNNGNVNKTLDATTGNQSYTIPAGYHGGSGKVQIVLETKTATPKETAQTITPTSGKVLSTVVVNAIPDNYVDVTDATEVDTTTAQYVPTGTVLYGKDANGEPSKVTGTATKYNAKTVVLDCTTASGSYTNTSEDIEKGYHEAGTVSIVPQTKTVTSSNTAQTVTADSGKVLASVTVNAMANATLSNPTVDTTTGLITTSVTTGGYVASGTKKTTQLTVQAAKTITPSTSSQTAVAKNVYTTGVITVGAIPSKYGDTSTATATASDILYGKTAFGKDSSGNATKLTGTMINNGDTSATFDPLTQTSISIAAGYTTGATITLTGDLEARLAAI